MEDHLILWLRHFPAHRVDGFHQAGSVDRRQLLEAIHPLHVHGELDALRKARVERGHRPVVIEVVIREFVLPKDGGAGDARQPAHFVGEVDVCAVVVAPQERLFVA